FAPQKAYTAAAFGAPTADFATMAGSDPALLASLLKVENVTLLGGGLPIVSGGVPIGGIGASGGSTEQDIEVATAGLAALGFS
ncbi:MAG: heme-binding protein, partial [Bradyrhizobium sp.]